MDDKENVIRCGTDENFRENFLAATWRNSRTHSGSGARLWKNKTFGRVRLPYVNSSRTEPSDKRLNIFIYFRHFKYLLNCFSVSGNFFGIPLVILLLLNILAPCCTHEALKSRPEEPTNLANHRDELNVQSDSHYSSANMRSSRSFSESSSANQHPDFDSRHRGENTRFSKFDSHGAQYSSQSSCSSCRLRKELRDRNLEFIKNQVLLKLGFAQAPNITSLPKMTPQRMQEVIKKFGFPISNADYKDMQGDDPWADSKDMWNEKPSEWTEGIKVHDESNDDFHAKTEKVVAFAQPYTRHRHGWKDPGILQFRFSDKIMRHRIKKATLYVYLAPHSNDEHGKHHDGFATGSSTSTTSTTVPSSTSNNKDQDYISIIPKAQHHTNEAYTIGVYRLYKTQKNTETPGLDLIATEVVYRGSHETDGKWIPLDVTFMLSTWFKAPRENLGFIIRATDSNGNKINVQHTNNFSHVPYVEVYTIDVTQRRMKRSYGLDCTENSEENRCCRYPLTVDFQEFGWDWIIAPKQYQANYCSGECGYVFLQKFPHTHIASLASPLQHDNKPAVEACCAPRKMSAISMLYFDHELNIIYGTLPNMVVDRCGCS